MGGDTHFGLAVHGAGSDLQFDNPTLRPENFGVERLVTVGLGVGDKVGNSQIWNRVIFAMDQTQGGITLFDHIHNHPGGNQIVDFGQIARVFRPLELGEETVKMFVAGVDNG